MALAVVLGLSGFAGSTGSGTEGETRAGQQEQDESLPLVQAGPVILRDIPYAEHGGKVLRLDVYRMEDAVDHPALVLVHGGSWRRRSKGIWSSLASLYAAEGYVVFAINYRLAPPGGEGLFPDPVGDVGTAIDWVRRNSVTYGVDPARVAVAGSSAGAHLALLAAGTDAMRPDAVLLFSAPVDLARLHREDVLRGSIENFVGCPPHLCPSTYETASGRGSVNEATPPVLVAYSRFELVPRDQPVRLVRRLEALGRPVQPVELAGSLHGMAVARRTFDETVAFLNSRF